MFYLSFHFVLAQEASARDTGDTGTTFTCWPPQCLLQHAGTRFCAQQPAISPTNHQADRQTQHRARSAGKNHKTRRQKARDHKATDSASGHNTASNGTKRATQHYTAQNRTAPAKATRSNASQHRTQEHSTAPQTKTRQHTTTQTTQHNDTAKDTAQHAPPQQHSRTQKKRGGGHTGSRATGYPLKTNKGGGGRSRSRNKERKKG